MIRFKFIRDHRTEYSVKRMCHVLKVRRSSYYKWKNTQAARRQKVLDDAVLGARIRAVFREEHGLYGAKRIAAALNDPDSGAHAVVNHKRVARIMKTMGIQGFTKKRRVRTTVADAGRGVFPDLVCRQFHAPAPNRVLVGDITYLPVSGGGNMYLATVIDCYSRRLVGFSIADHMRVDLVIDALDSAQRARGSLKGAIFHSDHGSVYTSKAFSSRCTMLGVTQSMAAVGTSADNALAESFNATLKREVLQNRKCFDSLLHARRDVFAWCVRYNQKRRHSWCDYLSPLEFENRTCGKLTLTA